VSLDSYIVAEKSELYSENVQTRLQ